MKGAETWGTAKYLGTGKGSNVYLYKAAFTSPERLYLTMGHEYLHVGFNNMGLGGRGTSNKSHSTIADWEYHQAAKWNFNVGFYQNRYNTYIKFADPAYNYRNLGFKILGSKPWL